MSEEIESIPVAPYFIKGTVTPKPSKFKTLVIEWNGEKQEVEIDKDGHYLFNFANFDSWDGTVKELNFQIGIKKELEPRRAKVEKVKNKTKNCETCRFGNNISYNIQYKCIPCKRGEYIRDNWKKKE